jgi:outer membrane protein OmpA-like peptidoglycan-associated protein
MKKLFIAALFLSGSAAIGQKRVDTLVYPNEKVIVETDSTTTALPGGKYTYNSIWDNWFISVGAGAQVYFGDQDAMKPLGKRLTPTYEAAIGKWVHPAVGLRAKIGGGLVKGFSDGTIPEVGRSFIVSGPDEKGIYTQKWHQLYVEGDILVDLCNAFGGYKPTRFYSPIFYIGAGLAYVQNQPRHDGDRTAMFVTGIINRFRVSNSFDINLEIKNSIVDQNYDREQDQKYYESFLAATAGVTYHIGAARRKVFSRSNGEKTLVTRTYRHIPIPVKEAPAARGTDTVIRQEIVREVTVEKKLILSHPMAIFFEVNSSQVGDRAKVNLAFLADIIKSSGGAKFVLIGSADKLTASPQYNQRLSAKRCEAVRDYLENVHMIDPGQLILEPVGGIDRYSPARVNRTVIIKQE